MNPEKAAGPVNEGQMGAYRSLARQAGRPLDDVLSAAQAGDLRAVVVQAMERRAHITEARSQLEQRQRAAELVGLQQRAAELRNRTHGPAAHPPRSVL